MTQHDAPQPATGSLAAEALAGVAGKLTAENLPGTLPMRRTTVDATQWSALAQHVADCGGRLVSLWGSDRRPLAQGFVISAAYVTGDGLLVAELPLDSAQPAYPDIAARFPAAGRMQRATFDLLGLTAEGAADRRPWLRHGAWPADHFPLRHEHSGAETFAEQPDAYSFVSVEGDGVHEIPVGPVHAGIIEPGHFRFSVVGEKVLRLEERLGYKHKGIDKRFAGRSIGDGARLAGRVCGDSTVAFAWAYAMAVETATRTTVPPRAAWLRALMLERERVANHLGDLGALGNDAAFGFGLAQFSRLREQWLRANRAAFGHRLMMDAICPGGVHADLAPDAVHTLRRQGEEIGREVRGLQAIYDGHAGLQDRFITTGRVAPQLAARLGLTGLAGRASGIASDLRCDFPTLPYDGLGVRMATHRNCDVAARVLVRFEEIFESLRLIDEILARLPAGPTYTGLGHADRISQDATRIGYGWIEGWRGEVLVAVEVDDGGLLQRAHCHDPSWQNWPVLEHAVIGNIVPDFPLINKSFNLSYAGQDL